MEILVGHDRLDPLVRGIGGGFGAGQHGTGVEDVEALVLHGAHIEVVHRDDHEDVQVVLAAVGLFVPLHRLLQAVHGVLAFVDVFRLDIDAQRHLASAHGGEAVLDTPEVTGHQSEQIGRLLERVFPGRPVTAVVLAATGDRVAVGKQHRIGLLVGVDGGGELAHHIRAVEVVGDLAEALGLALGAEHAAGLVQPLERGVAFRMNDHRAVDDEAVAVRLQGQAVFAELIVAQAQGAIIQRNGQQLELLTMQLQWRQLACRALGVAAHHQLGVHQRAILVQLEGQVGFINQVLGGLVILQMNDFRLFGAHGNLVD